MTPLRPLALPTRSSRLTAVLAALGMLLPACSGGPAPDRAAAPEPVATTPAKAPTSEVASADDASPAEAVSYRSAPTRDGGMVVRWRSIPDPLPVGEMCELEVVVHHSGDGTPVTGAGIHVRGQMPAHGHGMNLTPRATEVGEGRYRVRGMLLHMTGHWEIGIDVVIDDIASSAEFDLEVE